MRDSTLEGNSSPAAEDFFRREVEHYESTHYDISKRTLMSVRLSTFLSLTDDLGLGPEAHLLDAGCGPGHLSAEWAGRGFPIVALDTSEQMLRLADRRLCARTQKKRVPYALCGGSIEALPFRSMSFDLVGTAGVIEYLASDAPLLKECFRVLKPGGYIILSVTNRWSPAGWLDPLVEALKRNRTALDMINRVMASTGEAFVRPRYFRVRRHSPREIDQAVWAAGFRVLKRGYFFLLPWFHPLDRLFPRANGMLNRLTEPLVKTPLRVLAEGHYVLAQRPTVSIGQ